MALQALSRGFKVFGFRAFITTCIFAFAAAHAASYTLSVDASKPIGPLNRFWEKCVGSDHFYTVIKSGYGGNIKGAYAVAKNELGIKSVRAHGILNDDVGIYKENNGTPVYNFANYDSIMDYIVSLGWKPIVELSFMPGALASGTTTTCWYNGVPGNVTPPKDYTKWKNLVTEIIKHSEDRYGAAEIRAWRWEVWNEPDIKPQFFTGSEDDYFRMYDYAVEGAIAADPEIKIGGPATAISDTAGLLKRFVQHCLTQNYANSAKKSTKVDFISWHMYPWNEGDQNPTQYQNRNRGIVTFLKRYPQLKLENLQTEWNASARYNYFDDEANSSFLAKTVHSMFADQNQGTPPPDVFSFWVVSDIFEEGNLSSTSAFAGAMGMMLRQRDARKPSFNAFKMLHMLGDTILPMTGGVPHTQDKGLNGIATYNAAKNQAQVLIYDHTYGSGANPTFTTTQDNVKLTINNLPFGNGQIKVERWGVDKTHSNSFTTWVNQGRPAKPTTQQWDQLEADGKLKQIDSAYSVGFTGAALIKDFVQPQPGVTLFVLTGQSPVGAARPKAQPLHDGIVLEADARNGALELAYSLPRSMPVTLLVMSAEGRLASKAVSEIRQAAGAYRVKLESLAPGRYFCMLRSGETVVQTAAIAVGR